MRRGVSIAMVIFGLAALISGLQKLFPPANDIFYRPHVVLACIFAALVIAHIRLNWKSISRHFQGLGRWWLLVGLGLAAVIVVALIPLFIS
jgi:hypothetical protein